MSDSTVEAGGWGFPPNGRKAHYFPPTELISICRRWMYGGHRDPADSPVSRDDCAECRRKYAKQAGT